MTSEMHKATTVLLDLLKKYGPLDILNLITAANALTGISQDVLRHAARNGLDNGYIELSSKLYLVFGKELQK